MCNAKETKKFKSVSHGIKFVQASKTKLQTNVSSLNLLEVHLVQPRRNEHPP